MAYEPTEWKNREVEKPRTFTIQNNADGSITLIPAEGVVTEPGTPIMAGNMNKIEKGIADITEYVESLDNDIDDDPADITYYVRTNGNDDNDGKSLATAFATFGKALKTWKTITTGGKRTFDIGAGVDLTNYKVWSVKNKFGGEFVFNFNNAHEICPQFENLKCLVYVENFTRYDSGVFKNDTYGDYCYANNCDYISFDNMKVDRRSKLSGWWVVSFTRTRGRVANSQVLGAENVLYVDDFGYVFVWMLTGQMKSNNVVPIRAALGGIIDVVGFNITGATVKFEEDTGGKVFGIN